MDKIIIGVCNFFCNLFLNDRLIFCAFDFSRPIIICFFIEKYMRGRADLARFPFDSGTASFSKKAAFGPERQAFKS